MDPDHNRTADHFDTPTLARIVELAPDGVVIVDRDGRICSWNHGMTRIFGYEAAEVMGGPLDVIIPERLRQRHNDGFAAAVERGTSRYGDDDLLAVPATGKDGRSLSIEFSVVLLPEAPSADSTAANSDAQPPIAYVAAIIRDVTERWHAERDLRRRLRELEASTAAAAGAADTAGSSTPHA